MKHNPPLQVADMIALGLRHAIPSEFLNGIFIDQKILQFFDANPNTKKATTRKSSLAS